MDQRIYCKTDPSRRFITVNPTGGQISGTIRGLEGPDDQGRFSFVPKDQPLGLTQLTYQLDHAQKKFDLQVVLADAKFKLIKAETREDNNAQVVQALFRPEAINSEVTYVWRVMRNDDSDPNPIIVESSDLEIELTYDQITRVYLIQLTAYVPGTDCKDVKDDFYRFERFVQLGAHKKNESRILTTLASVDHLLSGLRNEVNFTTIPKIKKTKAIAELAKFKGILEDEDEAIRWINGDKTEEITKIIREVTNPIHTELKKPATIANREKATDYKNLFEGLNNLNYEFLRGIEKDKLDDTKGELIDKSVRDLEEKVEELKQVGVLLTPVSLQPPGIFGRLSRNLNIGTLPNIGI